MAAKHPRLFLTNRVKLVKTRIHIEKIPDMVPQKSSSNFHKVKEASCPGLVVRFNASVMAAWTPRSDLYIP